MTARRLVVLAVAAAAPAAVLGAVLVLRHGERPHRPTLAELAATNYRTLSRAESRRLVAYADSEYRCLVSRGVRLAAPVASRTRITMRAPGWSARQLADATLPCDSEVGPPPPRASLQARPHELVLYLPKRCLLNPAERPEA
jgi:hypothetical protein